MKENFPLTAGKSYPANWVPFCLCAFILLLLCLLGGQWGFIGRQAMTFPWGWGAQSAFVLPAGGFILLLLSTWFLGVLAFLFLPKTGKRKNRIRMILVVSVLCRLALLPHMVSDDVNRYLWEGRLIREDISPYQHAPQDPALAESAAGDPYHLHINHPDLPAAYPPLMLLLFALIGYLAYTPLMIKLLVIGFDLGTLVCILQLLQMRYLDVRWSVFYAFNPVILYSFAGQGHFDSLQAFFLTASLVCYEKKQWPVLFVLLGLAVQVKYIAVVTIPFFIHPKNYRYLPILLVTVLLPYFLVPATHLGDFFYSLKRFGEAYAFNGPIQGVLRFLFGEIRPATRTATGLLAAVLVCCWIYFHLDRKSRYRNDPLPGVMFVLAAVLLLMPTVHFWYLSWIIPLVCFRFSNAWLLLCATASFYFVSSGNFYQTGVWTLPAWAQLLEWVPFLLLLTWECRVFFLRAGIPVENNSAGTVSVIVPVINEAENLLACIRQIQANTCAPEIIVVDGGSTDETVAVSSRAGTVRIVHHHASPEQGGGRGGQIFAGLQAAKGDVIAVVHADVLVPENIFDEILLLLQKNPTIAGGAVGGLFDQNDFRLQIVTWLNDLRAAFFSISFGDQVQFFKRLPILNAGCYPAIPLMEDVELSIQIHRIGRPVYLFGSSLISARRWQTGGIRNGWHVLKRVFLYLVKRMVGKPDTVGMYHAYYGRKR